MRVRNSGAECDGSLFGSIVLVAVLLLGNGYAKTIRVDDLLAGGGLKKAGTATVSAAVETAARALRTGDALVLPNLPFGDVVLPPLPADVQLIGGRGESIRLTGPAKGLSLFGGDYNLSSVGAGAALEDVFFVNTTGNIAAGQLSRTYWIDHIGEMDIDGTMQNCTGVWMRYNNEGATSTKASFSFRLNGTGQNVKIIQMVEHNQGNHKPALYVENAEGMMFSQGSTEGCSAYNTQKPYIYELVNCKNVYLGNRRFFSNHRPGSDWYGNPLMTVAVTGGDGNILDHIVDVGNPSSISLLCSDPKVQLWATAWEHEARFIGNAEARFFFSMVENMMPGVDLWVEPRHIDDETVLAYEGAEGKVDLTADSAVLPTGVVFPAPPSMPMCDIPKPPTLLYKHAAGFGSAAIEAGADPTGVRSSRAAFERVLAERGVLEIGPGTYRLDRPMVLDERLLIASGRERSWIVGAGMEATRLVGPGSGPVILIGGRTGELSREAAAERSVGYVLQDALIDSGDVGVSIPEAHGAFNNVFINVRFANQKVAGVMVASEKPEQNRFIGCEFLNTGDYGFRLDTYSDKYLFFRCRFEGQMKGGIYATRNANWQSGIYQCSFKNIRGPGVAILGGGGNGYGPYVYRIDNCTFEECGSANQPVIHNGYGWIGSVTNCSITTLGRDVYAGFVGNFSVVEGVTINVRSVTGVGMYLGHQRYEKTAGIGGSRLKNVTTTGRIEFLPLSFMDEDLGNQSGYLPGLYEQHPWAFTWMFYNVKSENIDESYALYRREGRVMDLMPLTATGGRAVKSGPRAQQTRALAVRYDMRGRRLGNVGVSPSSATPAPARGLYITRTDLGTITKGVVLK